MILQIHCSNIKGGGFYLLLKLRNIYKIKCWKRDRRRKFSISLIVGKQLNSEAEPKAVKDKIEMMRLKEKVKNIEEVKHQRWWSRIYLWR